MAFDGDECLAMMREAEGRYAEAAEPYATVLEMMRSPISRLIARRSTAWVRI